MSEEQTVAPVVPGSPDHDAAMIAKYNSGVPQAPAAPEPEATKATAAPEAPSRPAGLPEKFKSTEDLAKAYAELERKLGSGKPAEKPAEAQQGAEGEAPEAPTTEAEKPAGEAPAGPAVDFNAMSNEVVETGDVSEASREALAKAGIPKEVVDFYVRAAQAEATAFKAAVHEAAGGEAQFDAIRAWAGENFSQAEKDFMQAQVSAGPQQARLAISSMRARYEAVHGKEPSLVGGRPGGAQTGYASTAEMKADMSNPQYKTDPAFRARVEQKLAASSI